MWCGWHGVRFKKEYEAFINYVFEKFSRNSFFFYHDNDDDDVVLRLQNVLIDDYCLPPKFVVESKTTTRTEKRIDLKVFAGTFESDSEKLVLLFLFTLLLFYLI